MKFKTLACKVLDERTDACMHRQPEINMPPTSHNKIDLYEISGIKAKKWQKMEPPKRLNLKL